MGLFGKTREEQDADAQCLEAYRWDRITKSYERHGVPMTRQQRQEARRAQEEADWAMKRVQDEDKSVWRWLFGD